MMARHGAITDISGMKRDNKCPIIPDRLLSLVLIGALCLGNLYWTGPTKAQFAVQPMVLSLKSKPGTEIKAEIRLQNLQTDSQQRFTQFDIQTIDLTQAPDGQWLPIGRGYSDSEDPVHPPDQVSCRSWLYPGDGFYETGMTESHDVTINVPEDAQGFYCAALSIKISRSREYQLGVITDYEFIVPIVVEVEGPALEHVIQLKDTGLEHDTATPAPSTLVTLEVENQGRTFSQLTGFAHVYAYRGNQLGPIRHKVTFDEVSIIPGSKLTLKKALLKSLPWGRYRVLADLSVDNRLVAGISREIELIYEPPNPQTALDPPIAALSRIEQSSNSKAGNAVNQYLQPASEPGAPVNQTVHYAISSPEPTVAIMKQQPIKVSQDATAHDPYHTYSGGTPLEFFTNTPVCLRASAVATSRVEGNWTCAMDPGSICGHTDATLYVVATDVRLEKLGGSGTRIPELARITVQVVPQP